MSKRTLLLNADYTPLHFLGEEDAITLFYKGRVDVVESDDGPSVWKDVVYSSPSVDFVLPATLRLKKYIKKKWRSPRFRKRVLFNRDDWCCQYCGLELSAADITMDHVLPSSRGGETSWLNCVAACRNCNRIKANKTPDEAKMRLLKKPAVPATFHFWNTVVRGRAWHSDWDVYVNPESSSIPSHDR